MEKKSQSAWDIFSLVTGAKSFVDNVRAGNVGAAVVDGLGVVVDAAAVVLPGIPGGVGVAAKGIRALDKAADTAKTMRRGVQNEAKVLKDIGATKNTAKKTVRFEKTGEKVTVIPDAVTDTEFIEIKDAKSVYNTKQIRAEREAAKKEGKSFVIITGEKTHVSGNIPDTEIIRRKDIGPQ